jgi:hypothetical protein
MVPMDSLWTDSATLAEASINNSLYVYDVTNAVLIQVCGSTGGGA